MNLNWSQERRSHILSLFAGLLVLGLIWAVMAYTSREPLDVAGVGLNASNTRTAVALTSDALLGPFPTATALTSTASVTARPSITPTLTPTATRTGTATPFLLFTWTPRTSVPRVTFTSTPRPTFTPRPTRTPVPPRPTNPANTLVPPTLPPPSTDIPTNPPPTTYP